MNNHTERRARLVAINSEAHRYYREQLLTSPAAQGPCRYLTQRRLAHVLAADSPWPVGYAPVGWTSLTDHLNNAGFSPEELLAAGVACRTRKGGIVDRFRDRIMLPQRDHNSDVVGFIGRAAPGAPGQAPKYLNSPRTEIYNKRELLFGLHEQRDALAEGCPVLVEGPLDVLAIAAVTLETGPSLAGLAPCGTALTSEQVGLIASHITNAGAVVAYDNDDAGRKAASSAYELLADFQCDSNNRLMAAVLPRGADPAEVLQVHGSQALRGTLTDRRRLVPLGQRVMDIELGAWAHVLDGAEGRIAAVRAVAPVVAKLPRADVARQVTWLAERVNLDPTTITIALSDALAAAGPARRQRRHQLNDTGRLLRAPPHATAHAPCQHVL